MESTPKTLHIGLVTPYSGFNLGEGATMQATIDNLKIRDPNVRCVGITLYPAEIARRHGIPAFPITGLVLDFYTDAETLFSDGSAAQESREPRPSTETNSKRAPDAELALSPAYDDAEQGFIGITVERLRAVKNIPVLGNLLGYLTFLFRDVRMISKDLRHWIRAHKMARSLDLLVVAGSGQMNEEWGGAWGHPYSLFKWAVLAKLTNTPFAVASVGTDVVESPLAKGFIRIALSLASYRSFRDTRSKEAFSSWHFIDEDPCVSDLAFSLDMTPYRASKSSSTNERIVAVSPINYGNPQYWPNPDPLTYQRYIEGLADFLYWLMERNYRVMLFRTSSGDRAAAHDLKTSLARRYGEAFADRLLEPEAPLFQDVLREVSKADLVIASRLHSVVMSYLLHKPVVGISWNTKVISLMEDFGQTKYMVDIRRADLASLRGSFEALEASKSAAETTIEQQIVQRQADLAEQYDTLLQLAAGTHARKTAVQRKSHGACQGNNEEV